MILVDVEPVSDPFFNLALEEYLVRHADTSRGDYLLFYANEPSVVLGKNQSIYKEVNFEYLRNGPLKMARRITGGGTVYHDPGNLSFSIISAFSDHKINNYRYFNGPVVKALRRAGLDAEMDARNNILLRGKKISGSAQFTNRKNIISHGTLLLNANLNTLRACLRKNDFEVESRAVDSVRSSVMNISEDTTRFSSIHDLKYYLTEELNASEKFTPDEEAIKSVEETKRNKISVYGWVYGRSPKTIIRKNGLSIEVEQGIIGQISGPGAENWNLSGVKYDYPSLQSALSQHPRRDEILAAVF